MTRVALLVMVALGCAAPAHPAAPLPPLPVSPAGIDRAVIERDLARSEDIADRACACEDDGCFDAVDADLITLAQTETENDPITDVETWPRDLDDLAHAAAHRILACLLEAHHPMTGFFAAMTVRRAQTLATAACACTTSACALRAAQLAQRRTLDAASFGPDAKHAVQEALQQTLRCAAQVAGEQSLLDLKSIRKDACACADAACAAGVADELQSWAKDNAHTPADQATVRDLREVSAAIAQCLVAARGN